MAINLTFPWKISQKGGLETNDDSLSAIKDNIRVLLLTNHNERPMQPTYGANLRQAIFEQEDDSAVLIEELIKSAIAEWIPEVSIRKIEIITSSNKNSGLTSNQVLVKLSFIYRGIPGNLEQAVSA